MVCALTIDGAPFHIPFIYRVATGYKAQSGTEPVFRGCVVATSESQPVATAPGTDAMTGISVILTTTTARACWWDRDRKIITRTCRTRPCGFILDEESKDQVCGKV